MAAEIKDDPRFDLVRSIGEECVMEDELRALLRQDGIVSYDGFEPSGRMHIAQGILKTLNVNKLAQAGVKSIIWLADWFAMLNEKMGGDLAKIRHVGEYMIEVWTAAGMDMSMVEFKWAQDEINQRSNEYWTLVMDIARHNSLARIKRCGTIMGREDDSDNMAAAQILYPIMQCADIFFLQIHICQLGMDQRKVNMLAREYASLKKIPPPVILSHHMLLGLKQGQPKMSKSDPDSAIFMEDSAVEVKRKIKGAYCPMGIVEGNPCLDYFKYLVFAKYPQIELHRSQDHGGDKTYTSYNDLETDFVNLTLHPKDLKAMLAEYLNAMIEPVRVHFTQGPSSELLKKIRSYKITR